MVQIILGKLKFKIKMNPLILITINFNEIVYLITLQCMQTEKIKIST